MTALSTPDAREVPEDHCRECKSPVQDGHHPECSRAPDAREVLRELEWSRNGHCPVCGEQDPTETYREPGGHAPGCRLAAALNGGFREGMCRAAHDLRSAL